MTIDCATSRQLAAGPQCKWIAHQCTPSQSDPTQRGPRRNLHGATELVGAGVSEAHPLQQDRQGRPLRGLGTAWAPCQRAARGVSSASQRLV